MSTAPRGGDHPTTYAELAAVITNLPMLVRERRRQERLSQRRAAERIGISFATVSRLETGVPSDGTTLAAVLRWLDTPTESR